MKKNTKTKLDVRRYYFRWINSDPYSNGFWQVIRDELLRGGIIVEKDLNVAIEKMLELYVAGIPNIDYNCNIELAKNRVIIDGNEIIVWEEL